MAYTPGTDIDGMQATLGSLRLGAVDAMGVVWRLQDLEGWDSPEIRAEYQEREADHGSWGAPVYFGSRPITLSGIVEANSRADLEAAMERLYEAAAITDTTLTVWESTPKQATVRRSGKVLTKYITDTKASWSVLVTAEDPRRYSTALETASTGLPFTSGGVTFPATFPITFSATTVAGQITASNIGSMDTRPQLTIAGPVVAPIVAGQYPDGTVRQLIYTQTLQSGDVLVIDTDAHTVMLNGDASRRRFLKVPSGWPTIGARSSVTYQFQAGSYNANALLTATWRSAWM
ncbi:hypothetical protein ABTZ58_07060 [Streptomyces sp. NPDC094143]|uniref:phage distal tail protein n=1 Tax=Streptomyces sp. NPDC094143 TaxID=3155310 RepID=UPI00332A6747